MSHRMLPLIAAAMLLGIAGCGSDDDDQAATTPAVGQVTTTEDRGDTATTTSTTGAAGDSDELSPQARAVLAETQDLAADVSAVAEDFAEGRIDDEEAMARLELAGARADDLRDRTERLPVADAARSRIASLNEEISRTSTDVSRLGSSGRQASRDEIDERIDDLRDQARSTFDAVRDQLDEPAQQRFRKALDRIGVG
jgi:hypothetical protein